MQIVKSRSGKILIGLAGATALGVAALFAPSLLTSKAVFTEASSEEAMKAPVPSEAEADQKLIDLAGYQVPVLRDGLYDRFRSNPPLSVIAEERPDLDLS